MPDCVDGSYGTNEMKRALFKRGLLLGIFLTFLSGVATGQEQERAEEAADEEAAGEDDADENAAEAPEAVEDETAEDAAANETAAEDAAAEDATPEDTAAEDAAVEPDETAADDENAEPEEEPVVVPDYPEPETIEPESAQEPRADEVVEEMEEGPGRFALGEDERAGYIPGYKRGDHLGLPPTTPRTPARAGGLSVPYHAPSDDEEWQFKFTGFASASLRLSAGGRDDPTAEQSGFTLHAAPRIPDFYGAFQGTNVTPGSWVDLHFQYGNPTVQAHATLTTWKPDRGAGFLDIRSQNWFSQAYLNFNVPLTAEARLNWRVGAFRDIYGGLGLFGAGQYNQNIIGQAYGVGETLTAEYVLNPEYTVFVEHGFMGQLGKVEPGAGPNPFDTAMSPAEPSSWVTHLHAGLRADQIVPWQVNLHYLTNWSQDEREQQDDPRTPFIDERDRPDGGLSVYGAELRLDDSYLGNAALSVAYADAFEIQLLQGLAFFGAISGEEITKRYFGQRSGGTGQMWAGGVEYNVVWKRLLAGPNGAYDGRGPELRTSVFSNAASVSSTDPEADGRQMLKFGTEVTYRWLKWLSFSGRYDHVIPNSKDGEETFDVISPKLLFTSEWITHEQVTLSYTKWFYGERTHAEFPFELPREELDDQMFALHFGMWW